MDNLSQIVLPRIRFEDNSDGRFAIIEQGKQVVYKEPFDVKQLEKAVCQLGLSQMDRASLYLDAADFSQDDMLTESMMNLAAKYALHAHKIDQLRQQYNIPLAPIGNVNYPAYGPYVARGNEGLEDLPPITVATFVPRLPFVITKEIHDHMVRVLESTFVPPNRGELALRAMGLMTGEMTNYVEWLKGLLQLTALVLFLLGRTSFVLKEEVPVGDLMLPKGSYGNGTPIVAARGGGDRHWQVVTSLFRDGNGKRLNSASLRSVASRLGDTDGSEFRYLIYLFYPLIFDTNNNPRPNNLFIGGGSVAGAAAM
jgi:hypothetical protein